MNRAILLTITGALLLGTTAAQANTLNVRTKADPLANAQIARVVSWSRSYASSLGTKALNQTIVNTTCEPVEIGKAQTEMSFGPAGSRNALTVLHGNVYNVCR